MRKYFLLLLFGTLFFIPKQAYTQSVDEWTRAADKVFTQKDYYSAFRYYGVALKYKPERADINYQYAESARLFGIPNQAETAYQAVINSSDRAAYPLAGYHLAAVKQTLGKYDEAAALYQQFLNENPNADADLQATARKGITDCEWAREQVRRTEKLTILKENVNSAYSEYGVTFKGDTMYYSSLRFAHDKDTSNPRRTYSKILRAIADGPGAPLGEDINVGGKHVGHTAFNADFTKVYYTICDYVNAADVRCDLYMRPVLADNSWGPASKLPINAAGYTTTQPSLAMDRQTGKQMLYFASDRPGGQGKLDLWRSEVEADSIFSTPENLSDLNTEGNDATPFFYESAQTLYFSTDGRLTLGGYDVYKVRLQNGSWATPENLGTPLNSSYNDLYYALFDGGRRAFISSNRPDTAAFYWDKSKETCCNDLYQVDYEMSVNLLATTFNGLDRSPLAGVTLELYEETPDGGEILISTLTNPTANDFNFPLERGKKYKLKAMREGYAPTSTEIDLLDLPEGNVTIERQLYLNPPVQLDVTTFENIDSMALAGVTIELYEIGPNGEEKLITTKVNPNSNDFSFPLERGKKYIIKANKDGYAGTTDTIDLTTPEASGTNRIERKLYLGQLLEARTVDAANQKPLEGATVELYDLSGPRPVLKGKKTNPTGNDFVFPLDLNKTYLIKASRPGYNSVEDTLRFDPETLRTSDGRIVIEIPLDRFSFDDYLPIALYFDNDMPDPRSYGRTTKASYLETNAAYYARKAEYVKEFTKGLSAEDKFLTERNFDLFFDREVEGARQELEAFTEELVRFLQEGNSINIQLRGYSSPRGASTYNQLLSARRIDCVKNHFRNYKQGVLLPYLKDKKLVIEEKAYGESTAKRGVSARIEDRRNSIFNIVACLERRVEIVEVKATGNGVSMSKR